MHQFAEGLELFGVMDAIKEFPQIMRPLFTAGDSIFEWDLEGFLSMIQVAYSPVGSNLYQKEIDTFKYFSDILEQVSIGGIPFQFSKSSIFITAVLYM